MRKYFLVLIAVLLLVPGKASAFHVIGEQPVTKLTLKADFMDPKNGESFVRERAEAYLKKGDLGLGGEVMVIPKYDYLRFRPYVTFGIGAVTPIIGFSTDSKGADFVDAGVWYSSKLGKNFSLFLDLRNYWGLNGKSDGFTDNFLNVSLNLNDKAFAGIDLGYDHYWKSHDDWYLVGIPIGYSIAKNSTIFARPAFEKYLHQKGGKNDTYSLRLGVSVKF